jgi:exocyst complex component 2
MLVDADIFYNLETWIAHRDAASSSTRYLSQFEIFQRHMMTSAYKIVASGDTPTAKSSKKRGTPQILSSKITKAFFDATHAFLKGLVILASEDSPIVKKPELIEGKGSMEMSLHELVDLKDAVSGLPFSMFPLLLT